MIKKLKNILELILAIVACILIMLVFFKPPVDYDAGPMFAYNLLFFLPLTFFAGIISLVVVIIVIRKFIRRDQNKKAIKIISLCLTTPILIYSFSIFLYLILPQDMHFPEAEKIPEPKYNSCDSIKISSKKTIHLVGYNWGKKLENRRLYISLTPYKCDTFTMTETFCCQGDSVMDIYFEKSSDSLFVFVPQDCNVYTHHGAKYLKRISAKTIKINANEMDSLISLDTRKSIKRYKWEK